MSEMAVLCLWLWLAKYFLILPTPPGWIQESTSTPTEETMMKTTTWSSWTFSRWCRPSLKTVPTQMWLCSKKFSLTSTETLTSLNVSLCTHCHRATYTFAGTKSGTILLLTYMLNRVVRKWSKLMLERFSKCQQLPFDLKIECSQMDFG